LQETKVISDVANFITTLESSPAFQTDVAAILSAAPASVLEEAYTDPEALLEDLTYDDDLPAWVSAIPTSVIGSLETLAAVPIEALSDVEEYLYKVADEPAVSSALDALQTAIPTSIQDAIESDPVAFLEGVATATTLPAWITDIPAPVQSEIGDVVNGVLSLIDADLEGSAVPTAVSGFLATAAGGYLPTAAYATGTGFSSVVAANGTKPTGTPAPSPSAFHGAAVSMQTVGVGLAAVMAGAALWINA